MGYKGIVKDNVIVLEQGVKLPEGTEVEVVTQGWWLSEEARRNATDKKALKNGLLNAIDTVSERRKQVTACRSYES